MKTDNSLEINLRLKDGVTIIMKADNNTHKNTWMKAFESQIAVLADKSLCAVQAITAEDKALTISDVGEKEECTGAGVKKVFIPSVALKKAKTSANVGTSGSGEDNNHLASAFNNYGSSSAVINVRVDSNTKSPGIGGAKLMSIDGVDQAISHSNPMHPRL